MSMQAHVADACSLATSPTGYRLNPPRGSLDVDEFNALVASALCAIGTGYLDRAASVLRTRSRSGAVERSMPLSLTTRLSIRPCTLEAVTEIAQTI